MKLLNKLLVPFAMALLLSGCNLEESLEDAFSSDVQVPDQFTIDIPNSLSSNTGTLSGRTSGNNNGVIEGNEIYESLRYFINIGETSAEIIESTLIAASALENSSIRAISYVGDDARPKRFNLEDEVTRENTLFEHELTIIDELSGEQALQLLWNTNPVEGFGILRPYQVDQNENATLEDAYVRIDYSENDLNYDATMTVTISGLEVVENGDVDNLKMFVGKNGSLVDVIGNSNHPNLVIIDDNFNGGRNYAFVGRGDQTSDVGVVKLALPPSATTIDDILVDYSVFNVLEDEIQSVATLNQSTIDAILTDAQSPAYFNSNGFITSGVNNKPSSFSDSFVDLTGMNPFVPNEVKNLRIGFIQ